MCFTIILGGIAGLLGFGPAGIVAGSVGAALMRNATILSGGAMSKGTILGAIVAFLQHITMV